MAQRFWKVEGVGNHSEVYAEEMKCWIKASRHVASPSTGIVEVSGLTDRGQRVTVKMRVGDTWLVR